MFLYILYLGISQKTVLHCGNKWPLEFTGLATAKVYFSFSAMHPYLELFGALFHVIFTPCSLL